MNSRKNLLIVSAALATQLFTGMGCASFRRSEEKPAEKQGNNTYPAAESNDPLVLKDQRIQSLESTVLSLNSRIQELEGKLQASQNRPTLNESLNRQSIGGRSNNGTDKPVRASIAANDPESGFANDVNTRAFQQGKILFDQEKYPEAILAFSAFLERNSNHTLASLAQYNIAESYYFEGDYAVADQEFQKLLLKYPRSPRASYALVRLSQCGEKLGKRDESRRYRLQAEGLYPRSPALKGLREATGNASVGQPPIQSALVVPPTAPEVVAPHVETPTVETPTVTAPHVEAPHVATPKVETSLESGADLDSPPGMGAGG